MKYSKCDRLDSGCVGAARSVGIDDEVRTRMSWSTVPRSLPTIDEPIPSQIDDGLITDPNAVRSNPSVFLPFEFRQVAALDRGWHELVDADEAITVGSAQHVDEGRRAWGSANVCGRHDDSGERLG